MKTIKHVFQIQPKVASFEVPSCSAHGAQSAILSGPTAADQSMSVLFAITLLGNGALFRVIVVDHTLIYTASLPRKEGLMSTASRNPVSG